MAPEERPRREIFDVDDEELIYGPRYEEQQQRQALLDMLWQEGERTYAQLLDIEGGPLENSPQELELWFHAYTIEYFISQLQELEIKMLQQLRQPETADRDKFEEEYEALEEEYDVLRLMIRSYTSVSSHQPRNIF